MFNKRTRKLFSYEENTWLKQNSVRKWFIFEATILTVRKDGILGVLPQSVRTVHATIEAEMQEVYEKSSARPHDLFWRTGQICAAQYDEDKRWYRGSVTSVNDTSRTCEVLFIDYGNTAVVKFTSLRKDLPPNVLRYPALALGCKLFKVSKKKVAKISRMVQSIKSEARIQVLIMSDVIKNNEIGPVVMFEAKVFVDDQDLAALINQPRALQKRL